MNCELKKLLFIDRDGTILREPSDEQIDSFEKFSFVPGAISALKFLRQHTDFLFIMVSNQDGLGTESYPEETFWPTQNLMLDILKGEGITFDAIHIDRSFPQDNLPTRKPGTAMLTDYMTGDYDLAGSFVIGDRQTDAKLAENLGCRSLILSEEMNWEKMVANAAPAIPALKTMTNTRSSIVLRMLVKIRKYRGLFVSPTARRIPLPML